jgi:hypothetical protein
VRATDCPHLLGGTRTSVPLATQHRLKARCLCARRGVLGRHSRCGDGGSPSRGLKQVPVSAEVKTAKCKMQTAKRHWVSVRPRFTVAKGRSVGSSHRQGIPAQAGTPTPHSVVAGRALPALLRKAMQAGGAGRVGVPPSVARQSAGAEAKRRRRPAWLAGLCRRTPKGHNMECGGKSRPRSGSGTRHRLASAVLG